MSRPLWLASVHHDGSSMYLFADKPKIGDSVTVRLRAGLTAPIEKVYLRTAPDGEQEIVPMHLVTATDNCRWWEVTLKLRMPRTGYRFLISTAEGGWWYNAAGITRYNPTDIRDFKLIAGYHAPAWVRHSTFYQIFPDRFYDGDSTSNVHSGEYTAQGKPVVARVWGERPHTHQEGGGYEFFGGDLQGIAQRLDYLQDLGITALYLNPIFTSPSNHKYDVADYYEVDKHFGGNAALVALRRALDERGMRLMLDIVPNHVSATHPWFLAAQTNLQADTAEFFTFRRHPNEYESWLGVRTLPKLNYNSSKLRRLMFESKEAIMRYWLRKPYRIDGWRVDVANMMGRQGEIQLGNKIGRAMRRAVKQESPEMYLLGEHFFDGTSHLQGDELDASMNYQGFTFPLWHWLAAFETPSIWRREWEDNVPLPAAEMAAQWLEFMSAVPWQIVAQQFNLLDSHDTPRILSIVGNDPVRVKIASTLQFTFPGTPCLYYGDEIGLEGAGDPDNRRCMVWDESKWNLDLREHYRQLTRLRKESTALQAGGFQIIYAQDETVAYQREAEAEGLLVVARRSDDGLKALPVAHTNLTDGMQLVEYFSGASAMVGEGLLPLTTLPSVGAQIWIYKSK
ncbi:MAG: maltodextrin glucosidase [Chloroflexi bacterium]|uniref:Maltodextrin glucosidase n=1 Tax=Candidatus Chlorohelix allophototropha TaxID=3003348 RepID=A0A8T7M2P5_9CHLR|nr:maltodextrin glucosidase [Chloroflexota bacterium]WJW66020.1 maltodextrin glucosidase [Chloroflexota bacterium L227-S17]